MRERLEEVMRRICAAAPFGDGAHAQTAMEEIMRMVEDEFSGIRENPDAHLALTTDGRMYPPHANNAIPSGSAHIRAFRQKGHRTFIGDNGALRIERLDGVAEIDLAGIDGRKIADLRAETENEPG
jgi:hypothetical protein